MAKNRKKDDAPSPERVSGMRDAKDRREVIDVFARAFTGPGWMERHMDRALLRGPIFDPEHTRVAVVDGRVVSAVTMAPRMVRFGVVKVPAMTVGPVGTHDHYRKRGYSSAAMEDASRYMAENGCLAAYLQGISDYYYRFGYYPYMAPGHVKIEREKARKEARPGRLRVMREEDLPGVRRLYAAVTRERMCAAVRDADLWHWLTGPGGKTWLFRKPRLILDAKDKLHGYVTEGQHGATGFGELVVRQKEESCRVALGVLVKHARRHEARELKLPLPWDDALAVFIRHNVPAEWHQWSGATGGALMAVVDFPVLMKRLEPTFAARWQEACSALPPVAFTISTEIGRVGIALHGDDMRITEPVRSPQVRIPRRWLSGLLTGYFPVSHVMQRKGASVPTKLRPYMDILFPPGCPFVYQGDNY